MAQKTRIYRFFLALSSAMMIAMTSVAPPAQADDNPGTTEHIENIFIGRCYDYKQIKYKSTLPQVSEPCEKLYEKFAAAFSDRPPCALDMDNYKPFINAARQEIPQDKAMFWSGTKELAHEYASEGERLVTMEDTLIGYLADGLVWCGQSVAPGMNFSRCPSWRDCPSEASEAFWGSASMAFAQSVSGHVTVMMDVSREDRPAYRRDSFFGKYELPNLDTAQVTAINVLLTHPLEQPAFENCNNGSLVLLKQDVTTIGFPFSCVDNPDAILHLLCVENPSDRACHLASKYMFQGLDRKEDTNGQPLVLNSKPSRFVSTDLIG
ncbi:ADP-ribosyl cyclase/cyclic ADP-ribose hydrolase-like isoform X2 [Babylonia areolata]